MALSSAGFPLPRTLFELFAGAAGLGLGLHSAIPGLRTVGYVEREAYAAAVLVARMADALLDQAPIWDDVATFDGRPWCGVVDLLAGGFPCQDISVAGKGAGLAGARSGLWSEFARIISEIRPRYVFIENVAALRSRGLDSVLSDLAALGFDAEWTCYRAGNVGAPHRRDRIFILAVSQSGRRPADRLPERSPPEITGPGIDRGPSNLARMANPGSDPLRDESGRGSWTDGSGSSLAGDVGPELADPHGAGGSPELGGKREGWRISEHRGSGGFNGGIPPIPWPPRPDDTEGWRRILIERPDLEPALRRMADGVADRVERLRLCGNGVVPAQAAEAFSILWDRMING